MPLAGVPGDLPDPGAAESFDEIAIELRRLKSWAGDPSYESIKSRVNAAWTVAERPSAELTSKSTVADCFRPGRQRLNTDLVLAVVEVLHSDTEYVARWRDALRAIGEMDLRPATAVPVVAAQLPANVAGFTGRREHLSRLDKLAAESTDDRSRALVICAVFGTAGVGKTALAVHWAHQVADQFPDGQLYINLRGFDASGHAMDPAEAVRGFLDALGVLPHQIPPDLTAQQARYRSLIAGRRVLVVLDNARDTEQVRPLLPGTPTAVVVVTSRNQLTGLVAVEGAHPLTLDVMSPDESRDLLIQRLGDDKVAAEPGAMREIIARCARLPLALGIAAARARQSGFPLADLAAELGQEDRRLSVLDAGDPASDVRAVFSWSYTTLDPAAARLFRLLSEHPGPDVSIAVAASIAGVPLPGVRRLLAELVRANLLVEHAVGRYNQHDLLRAYATDLTRTHDSAGVRFGALTRLLDHYTHTACAANRLLYPTLSPIRLPLSDPVEGAGPQHLADAGSAIRWLSAEHANLLAVLARAGDQGRDEYAWQLAWGLDIFHYRQQHWRSHAAAWQTALAAADRLGNLTAKAHAHRRLALAYSRVDRLADAYVQFQYALELFADAGDGFSQAGVLLDLAALADNQGDRQQALAYAEQGRDVARVGGHEGQLAAALNHVGWMQAMLKDYSAALTALREGLVLTQRGGDRETTAYTLDSLGYTLRHLGEYVEAIDCYERSTAIFADLGHLQGFADSYDGLGDTYQAAGDIEAALAAWSKALADLDEINHSMAEAIREKIQTHGAGAGSVTSW